MTLKDDELVDYVESSRPTRVVATPLRKPRRARRVALVVVGAGVAWAAIASFTGSSDRRGPSLGPASSLPIAPAPPSWEASAEYVWAEQPTTPSYHTTYGARYNTAQAFLGPVDVTITRNQPGDYTVMFHNFAVVGASVRVTAYGGSSTCYEQESGITGADEQIRVICANLSTEVPLVYAGPFVDGFTDSQFRVDIASPATSSGR